MSFKRSLRGASLAALAAILVSGLAVTPVVLSQQAAPKKPAAANLNQGAAKAPRRLPRYYGQLVSPAQREKIYEVQASYQEQIDALEAQLKAVIEKRDAEIEAVLTPEQRENLAKLRAEAEQRSAAKKRNATDPAAAGTAPASAKKPAAGN